jgi:hypothetical protein
MEIGGIACAFHTASNQSLKKRHPTEQAMEKFDDSRPSYFPNNIVHPYIHPYQHQGFDVWSPRLRMLENMRVCSFLEEARPQG